MALLRRRGRQGQRTLKCWHQRTSGEPLSEQGRIRGFSRRLGDCSGSTVFAALPDRRLVLTPEIRAFPGSLPDSLSSFPSTRKCALALLGGALGHFRKVTRSYWPGLFPCDDVPDLPRTDNDLEQLFGSHRYHERRCSGRKVASPGLVVRGSVRVPAALATRLRGEVRGEDLAPSDLEAWQELRAGLERRQAVRALGRRFRRDPAAYLQELEEALIKETLPP